MNKIKRQGARRKLEKELYAHYTEEDIEKV
jgi:hypothetical protein